MHVLKQRAGLYRPATCISIGKCRHDIHQARYGQLHALATCPDTEICYNVITKGIDRSSAVFSYSQSPKGGVPLQADLVV